jgi:hypothetical protein
LPTNKCPLCESACIIKIIATQDEKYCEVDVCKMCGTMYPRGRDVVRVPARPKAKKAKATLKKPKKK